VTTTDSALLTTPDKAELYRTTLEMLNRSGVPYLVGGTYAFQYYAGIARTTKDFDIFVRQRDVRRVLDVLNTAGFRTEVTFTHWLAKAHRGENFIDIIYSSGNGVAEVDDEWFAHAVDEEVLGVAVKLSPAEEMIWSKAMIMERERYDGADVAHVFRHCSGMLNWERLLRRFGPNWRVLLSHLVLYPYVYPTEPAPKEIIDTLLDRAKNEPAPDADMRLCRGPLLSRAQYLVDVERWNYVDARQVPLGTMTPEEIDVWTKAIEMKK
jgi:hypothetical protein